MKRIALIAEDDACVARVIKRMLTRLGFETRVATDGEAALSAVLSEPYDVVLLDMGLPRLTGADVAARIREAEAGTLRRTRILAVTGDGASRLATSCDVDGYLAKPFSMSRLDAALKRFQSAQPAANATLDPEVLREALDGDTAEIHEIATRFVSDANIRVEELTAAAKKNDLSRVERVAHRLKGAAGMVGAKQLASLTAALELTPNRHRELLPIISDEILLFEEALAAWLPKLDAG